MLHIIRDIKLPSFLVNFLNKSQKKVTHVPKLPKEVADGAWTSEDPSYYHHRVEDAQVIDKNGLKYARKVNDTSQVYTVKMVYHPAASGWNCLKCRSGIRCATIIHRHIIAGIETRDVEHVPYCPQCEEVPVRNPVH